MKCTQEQWLRFLNNLAGQPVEEASGLLTEYVLNHCDNAKEAMGLMYASLVLLKKGK